MASSVSAHCGVGPSGTRVGQRGRIARRVGERAVARDRSAGVRARDRGIASSARRVAPHAEPSTASPPSPAAPEETRDA